MNICITGGAGFLGLHLARYLAHKKHRITIIDIADFPKKEYPKTCIYKKADIRDKETMNRLTKGQNVMIHAAAALPLWKNEEILDINVEGTRTVLSAAKKNNVQRFIYISSTAVYGVPKVHPIYENDPLVGVGAYGKSKIAAEALCEEYRRKGMIVSILRPKTFVGTHRLGVFEILFDWVKEGRRIPVIGNGNNQYQLLDVDDLCEAVHRLIYIDSKKANDTFNIGAERFKTIREDLQELFDYAHSGSTIFPTPALPIKIALRIFEVLKLSPLYQWVYDTADKDSYVSINRLIDTLHWKPKYSNAQALIKSYRWYVKHYQEIKSQPAGVTHTVGWKQGILGFFKKFL